MAKLQMTHEFAYAAGKDAANAQMRREGRTKWSIEDYNLCVQTFNTLLDSINLPNLTSRALEELAGNYASKVHFQHFTWPDINMINPITAGALADLARTTNSYLSEI